MKLTMLTLVVLLIVGCADRAYVYQPAADHPANPAAATAPLPAASTVLTATLPAAPAPTTAPAAVDHSGHAGHTGHATPATTQAAAPYVCPMHPEVTSTDPKARCHICGMFLKPPKGAAR